MLHRDRKAKIRPHGVIASHTEVSESAATGDKLLTHFLVAEIELQTVARAKPIVRPSLGTLTAATDPIAYQGPVVGVTVAPGPVLIERTWILRVNSCTAGYIEIGRAHV